MLNEYGFGHDGTGAAGTGEPGDCRQQMQKEDGQTVAWAESQIVANKAASE